MQILRRAKIWCKVDKVEELKRIKGIICNIPGEEILLGMSTLLKWKIIHPNFPNPQSVSQSDEQPHSEPATENLKSRRVKITLYKEIKSTFQTEDGIELTEGSHLSDSDLSDTEENESNYQTPTGAQRESDTRKVKEEYQGSVTTEVTCPGNTESN